MPDRRPTVHGVIDGALRCQPWHVGEALPVRGNEEPLVTWADGRAAPRIALAVAESTCTGAAVRS
jgi:hypothetical protein